ncbi:MAG: hypothetical protein ACPGTU_11485 [Myxococcota bacterium]
MRVQFVGFCLMFGMGCTGTSGSDKQPESEDSTPQDEDSGVQQDSGDGGDTGEESEPDPPAYLLPGAFVGQMNATNIYDGSLGHYEEDCTGDAAFTIDEDFVVNGTGNCATSWLDMGFLIEGTQEDDVVVGNLVAENETDRVETPFTGTRTDVGIELSFDSTHVNGEEQLRIVGTVSVVLAP